MLEQNWPLKQSNMPFKYLKTSDEGDEYWNIDAPVFRLVFGVNAVHLASE